VESFVPADVRVFGDPEILGAALADEVLARYDASDGPYLLGCPGTKPAPCVPRARRAPARARPSRRRDDGRLRADAETSIDEEALS
jgi:hypothetical protein